MFSDYIKFLSKYSLSWILWLSFCRFIFGVYNILFKQSISFIEFIKALYYGIYMDLSIIGYLMLFVLILFMLYHFLKWKSIIKLLKIYTIIIICIFSLISAIDTIIYKDWGYKLDATPLFYLKKAGEVSSFISLGNFLSFLIILLILILSGFKLFSIFCFNRISIIPNWISGTISLFLIPLMIIPIRGGIGLAPINLSSVYFSSNLFANHLAVNTIWNVIYSITEKDELKSKFDFMPDVKAQALLSDVYNQNDSTIRVLNNKRPNVLFIILESFTGKVIDYKLQDKEVTPNLNRWCREELYFSEMYASADRTDEGLVALFSGFPSQPKSAIMNYPDKCRHLPSILTPFKQANYSTQFFYGGDLEFANMSSYLLLMKVDSLTDKRSFPQKTYNAKWGVHDHILFNYLYSKIMTAKSPFFFSTLSLSSHPPYDIPVDPTFKGNDESTKFLNTMHYTDDALGKIIRNLKSSPVWNDLLVIITADHGAREPNNSEYHTPQRFKVPMIWMGGALKNRIVLSDICSQTDFSRTLLNQFGFNAGSFIFSNNILSNRNKNVAWYAFNNGFTFISKSGYITYSNDNQSIVSRTDTSQLTILRGKAILQLVTKKFTEY